MSNAVSTSQVKTNRMENGSSTAIDGCIEPVSWHRRARDTGRDACTCAQKILTQIHVGHELELKSEQRGSAEIGSCVTSSIWGEVFLRISFSLLCSTAAGF